MHVALDACISSLAHMQAALVGEQVEFKTADVRQVACVLLVAQL